MNLRLSGSPKKFALLGNASLEDGTFRLKGLTDEFKNAQVQVSLSQDRLNVDRFQANLGGGEIQVRGNVLIDRFKKFEPNLALTASRVNLKTKNYLTTQASGEFSITGRETPYLFAGRCTINEARLTDFNAGENVRDDSEPVLRFDVKADARNRIFVTTDVMDAEFRGSLNLVGNTSNPGLLGSVDGIKGSLLFKDTKFALTTANVKFEEREKIHPRFNVSGRAVVREQRTDVPQDYEVNLQVIGTPTDYKIRLTSIPSLAEPDLISLLVLGVTTRGQEGNYVDLGSVIAGQTPFQSKIQNEFGVDIKMGTQTRTNTPGGTATGTGSSPGTTSGDQTVVPSVKIQKNISEKTKLSYSTTVGEEIPFKEFRIEHLLNENFTVNGTALERSRGGTTQTDPVKSYGLDFRYHFTFE
jgi:autotransporter translocation and assembly factor TamB